MEKRSTVFARLLAALALAAAVVAVVVIVSAATSDDSHPGKRQHHSSQTKHEEGEGEGAKQRTKATTYTVKSGDTLIAIAHQTGLPVAEILALNPEVDPQILTVGQTLKLK
jgi:LysM repeat protein